MICAFMLQNNEYQILNLILFKLEKVLLWIGQSCLESLLKLQRQSFENYWILFLTIWSSLYIKLPILLPCLDSDANIGNKCWNYVFRCLGKNCSKRIFPKRRGKIEKKNRFQFPDRIVVSKHFIPLQNYLLKDLHQKQNVIFFVI